ncbi:MAG: aldolase [Bryobacterales bacterium]|nr:aldolase [Bryobacterales bacterium]
MFHRFLPVLLAAAGLAAEPADSVNPVKRVLDSGGIVFGGTITAANLDTAAVMANAGFDFLWIEGEHSPITLETTRNMILATRGLKAVPFTRVPVNETWTAKRMLDIGSLGVIFPFTSTPELARQAVAACKYPPEGVRGSGPSLAMLRWPVQGYPQWANRNVMVIVIIEQKEAVERIAEIAAVPGIDVLFIGTSDLSYSYGTRGNSSAPAVQDAVRKVLAEGTRRRIPVGGPAGSPAQIRAMIQQGFRFIQGPSDLSLMRAAAQDFFTNLKKEGVEHKEPIPLY